MTMVGGAGTPFAPASPPRDPTEEVLESAGGRELATGGRRGGDGVSPPGRVDGVDHHVGARPRRSRSCTRREVAAEVGGSGSIAGAALGTAGIGGVVVAPRSSTQPPQRSASPAPAPGSGDSGLPDQVTARRAPEPPGSGDGGGAALGQRGVGRRRSCGGAPWALAARGARRPGPARLSAPVTISAHQDTAEGRAKAGAGGSHASRCSRQGRPSGVIPWLVRARRPVSGRSPH